MKIKNIQIISLLVGFLLFIYVISKIDFSHLNMDSFSLNFSIIFFIFLLTIILFMLRTFRWRILLTAINIKLSFAKVHLLTASSMGLSTFTPAQSGDVLKIELLKAKYGIPRRKSFSTLIMEKAQDLFLISFISIIFLAYKGREILNLNYIVLIIVVLILLIAFFISVIMLQKRFEVIKTVVISFRSLLKKPSILIMSFILTLIYWLTSSLIWVLLAKIVKIDITFTTMLFVMSATILFGIITLIPGAIGAMEASSALLIAMLTNYPLSTTALFALMARLEDILIFIIGYLHLFFVKKQKILDERWRSNIENKL